MDNATIFRNGVRKFLEKKSPVVSSKKTLEERVAELERKVEPITELFELAQPE